MSLNPIKYIKNKYNSHIAEKVYSGIKAGIEVIKAQSGYGGYFGMNGMSGGAKWAGGLNGGNVTINHAESLRAARVAYAESLQAKSVVDRYADTVADTGLKLEPTPIASIIGITPEQAELWAEKVEQAFHIFAMDKKQSRSGDINFYQSHRAYQTSTHRDGEVFVRLYYSNERNLQNPLQFQFIDPTQIRGNEFTTSIGLQYIKHNGIKRDSQGRETHYDIYVIKDDKYVPITIPRVGPKSKRIMMLHGYMAEYAGQGRGFSRLYHAVQDLQNITDFSAAEVKKAIFQSMMGGYILPSENAPASNFGEGMAGSVAADEFGSNPNPSEFAQNVDRVSVQNIPEATRKNPDAVVYCALKDGEDFKPFANNAPSASYDAFVTSITSTIAASMSIPVEVLLMKFNSNYSASRAALILFWRVAEIWRQEMAADYLNPIYEMWLSGEIAAGRISAPGWSDPRIKNAWLSNSWIGAPMPNIDPMKTAKATRTNIITGISTIDREARNHNGSNAKSNLIKNTKMFAQVPESPYSKGTE